MISLLEFITTTLRASHPRVYLEQAPTGSPLPYAVYTLPSVNELENREDFTIEVEIWDKGSDTTALETLYTNLQQSLHRVKHYDETKGICTRFYKVGSGLMLPDPDPNLHRRLLTFEARTYFI